MLFFRVRVRGSPMQSMCSSSMNNVSYFLFPVGAWTPWGSWMPGKVSSEHLSFSVPQVPGLVSEGCYREDVLAARPNPESQVSSTTLPPALLTAGVLPTKFFSLITHKCNSVVPSPLP